METLIEAMQRLRAAGYDHDLATAPGGRLTYHGAEGPFDPTEVVVDETVRFEGDSNPDDEAVLVAITGPGGLRGLFVAAYGPSMSSDDSKVMQALINR